MKLLLKKARKRFKHLSNFDFQKINLKELCNTNNRFDYILFSSILHHVNEKDVIELLASAEKLLSKDGMIVVSEPLPSRISDNFLVRFYANVLEQGKYLREADDLEKIINSTQKFSIKSLETEMIGPFIIGWPKVNRFTIIVLIRKQTS